ncbi:Rap1-interacting factor 1 N terminal-domain-containing protein [Xylogone sp. PMI_703]|nr:Rap1-interacting factor 1 N terminal-domain-containing protein [Xylogone sp. PMI_703]
MVQPAPDAEILPNIARPPTPPRGSDRNATKQPTGRIVSEVFKPTSSIRSSRSSGIEPLVGTPASSRKKVGWSEWTEYKDSPADSSPITTGSAIKRTPIPSSAERRPIKSILKNYNGNTAHDLGLIVNPKFSPPYTFPNLATMLESTVQQLAGRDRSSRMDAYTTLSGALKASDNVPDIRALKDKMGLLTQFIQRDLSAKTLTGTPDTSLTVNALVLLSSFLQKPAIAELLNTEFSIAIVEHCIKTLEDPEPSKDVVKHLMFIMAQQNFSTKIMNSDRIGRLIKAVHGIEDHVKGKSISMGRIDIYRNLLRHSRTHMLANTEWIRDLFTDMLSPIPQIRSAAIMFGSEASLILGTEPQASRAVMDLCLWEVDDSSEDSSVKYAQFYAGRLKQMVRKKQDGSSVPHIWSVVVLFLRCRPHQLEKWAYMKEWLEVIQECFNSSDLATKLEANYAWNCFVFAVRPDEKTALNLIKTLAQPLSSQLRRKDIRKLGGNNKSRRTTIGSICNLLYYCLRPGSTATQLNQYWDAYVAPLVGMNLTPQNPEISPEMAAQDMADACHILNGLFDCANPRVWKETRASEPRIMDSSELPALDSRWLRSNTTRVFDVLTPLVEKLFWNFSSPTSDISRVWRSYINSVASAGIKEVKVSIDTMTVVAAIFNILHRIWHAGPGNPVLGQIPEGRPSHNFLNSFSGMILPVIEGLGLLPFTERLLSMGQQDMFVVISTPSQRPPQSRGEMRSPFHHLFILLTDPSAGLEYDNEYLQMVRTLLAPFFDARKSNKSRIDLVQDLLQLLPAQTSEACNCIWLVLAEISRSVTEMMDENSPGVGSTHDEPLGVQYRNLVKVLDIGIEVSGDEPPLAWHALFKNVLNSASIDAGDGGKAIGVIEPLARILLARISSKGDPARISGLEYCQILCDAVTYPKSRQALDGARRRLWGVSNPGQKDSSLDPYNYLYEYICVTLENTYTSFDTLKVSQYVALLTTINKMLDRCPRANVLNLLAKLQKGVACWIRDEHARISYSIGINLSNAVTSLWKNICNLIQSLSLGTDNPSVLQTFETLLLAGMDSKHRSIVNLTIGMWNSAFGHPQTKLQYPQTLVDAIHRLNPIAELLLPADFPESRNDGGSVGSIDFLETQDGSTSFGTNIDSILRKQQTPYLSVSPLPRLRSTSPMDISSILSPAPSRFSHSRQETPEPAKRKTTRQITPNLKHNDSQVYFKAIESSPQAEQSFDSQLLTERQKEVRERQQTEAAMFPDIRSSPDPRLKSAQRRHIPSDELQLLRSSASVSQDSSTRRDRENTPTLATGDGDDFITSSPTPTRTPPRLNSRDVSDPPSSPPETMVSKSISKPYMMRSSRAEEDIYDVPSSPPEQLLPTQNSNSASLPPSAQVDPYAPVNSFKLSTLGTSSKETNASTSPTVPFSTNVSAANSVSISVEDAEIPSPRDISVDDSQDEGDNELEKETNWVETSVSFERPRDTYDSSIIYETTIMDTPERLTTENVNGSLVRSRTPPTKPAELFIRDQTPNAHLEIYVDALSSPVFSDKQAGVEEVWVDAVSSQIESRDIISSKQTTSSAASDFDESSLLRLMDQYDENSAELSRRASAGVSQKKAPSVDDLSRTPTPSESFPALNPIEASVRLARHGGSAKSTPAERRTLSSQTTRNGSKAPSTPKTPPQLSIMDVQGDVVDYDDTIIVDVEGSRYKRATPRETFLARIRAAEASKKRKRELVEDEPEIPKSQEASTKDDAEPPRKIRGRRRSQRLRASRNDSGETLETSKESPASASTPSNFSVIITTPKAVEPQRALQEPRGSLINRRRKSQDKEEFDKVDQSSTSEAQVNSLKAGIPTRRSRRSEPQAQNERHIREAVTRSRSASRRLAELTSTLPESGETSSPLRATTAQIVADKLQNIITDLSSGTLSRDEIQKLEDLFGNAKEALYKAGKRKTR